MLEQLSATDTGQLLVKDSGCPNNPNENAFYFELFSIIESTYLNCGGSLPDAIEASAERPGSCGNEAL
jgi:hypothetical protein